MNIKELKEYIKDLPDELEIAYFDDWDYNIASYIDIREETPYIYTWGNPTHKKLDKQKLLIFEYA